GAFLNFADVDQHSGGRIGLTGKNKVSDIVAARAITRAAFFAEKFAVLFCGEFGCKQPPRSGELDAFADGQQHDGANPTTRNRANRAVGSRASCLTRPAGFQPGETQNPTGKTRFGSQAPCLTRPPRFQLGDARLRKARCLSSETGWKPILQLVFQEREKLGAGARVVFESTEQAGSFHDRVLL